MNKYLRILALLVLITHQSISQNTVGLIQKDDGNLENGYVLFAPISSTKTYLIDKCGKQVQTWNSDYKPGQSCYILPDGTLLRSGNVNNTTFTAGGKGGIIQKIDWNGNVTWSYQISSTTECQHHDIKALPNGNVLAIVWEAKTYNEAIEQGRNPALTTSTIWSEKIIEIEPNGTSDGTIVWEWHLWDHLIQDFDATKPNYGNVSSNSQLINLNYSASANSTIGQDWIHLNSIDYNPTLNQILVSSHSFDEIWIIDHSTTTKEAASHSGGNSNMGGDIIYRWGNPQAYKNGDVSNQKFFAQHNAHWIENGKPYENQIMVFNNGNGRTNGNYSSIEIINPPVTGYNYNSSLPDSPSWTYNNNNPNNFYAQNISGAEQLSNGNVLICDGPKGTFSEINSNGTKLWEYVNPVNNSGILSQGTTASANLVFRCSFYPNTFSGFSGKLLSPTTIIENSNSISNTCEVNLDIIANVIEDETFKVLQDRTYNYLTIYSKKLINEIEVKIINSIGATVYESKPLSDINSYTIDISQFSKGLYVLKIRSIDVIFVEKFIKSE